VNRAVLTIGLGLAVMVTCLRTEAQIKPVPGLGDTANLELALRRAGFTGSVLQVTAHADDENHGALAYLSRKLGARVALLTLTHGGAYGNNLDDRVGPALGVLRTQELLAADQYYGVDQFFGRATDSGTVRDGATALRLWGHKAVLQDVVRIIRYYRPDVILMRWQGNVRDGHGHHQASALLAREAFRAAADASQFPEQVAAGLRPWQAQKLYMDWLTADQEANVEIDAGEYDPTLGSSYAELGARGLQLQRSQVQRVHARMGPAIYRFQLVDSVGERPIREDSIFDGLDTSLTGLARFAGDDETADWLLKALAEVQEDWEAVRIASHSPSPYGATQRLIAALDKLTRIDARVRQSQLSTSAREELRFHLEQKIDDFTDVAARALGLELQAYLDPYVELKEGIIPAVGGYPPAPEFMIPGYTYKVTLRLWNRSPETIQVTGCELIKPDGWQIQIDQAEPASIAYNQSASFRYVVTVPETASFSQPNWERRSMHDSLTEFRSEVDRVLPRQRPALRGHCNYTAFGVRTSMEAPVRVRRFDRLLGEQEEEAKIVPLIAVRVQPALRLIKAGEMRVEFPVDVTILNNGREPTTAELILDVPYGWPAQASRMIEIHPRQEYQHTFLIRPPILPPGEYRIRARVKVGDREYVQGYDRIAYPGLEPEHLYLPAETKLAVVDVILPEGLRAGLFGGQRGNQELVDVVQSLGGTLEYLQAEQITLADLRKFDAVILGQFAFAAQPALRKTIPTLETYVEHGGVVISFPYAVPGPVVPYPIEPREGPKGWGPFPYTLPANVFESVVDLQASAEFILPEHVFFRWPNRLEPDDLRGWVSGLAAGTAADWDSHYQPLLALHESDGRESQGSLLVARYGKGWLVHCGLLFSPQLRVPVAGAVRILANLLSLGRSEAAMAAR